MRWTTPIQRHRNVSFWLQADIQAPEIDFRFAPESGHSEAHAGLPVLTLSGLRNYQRSRDWRAPFAAVGEPVSDLAGDGGLDCCAIVIRLLHE